MEELVTHPVLSSNPIKYDLEITCLMEKIVNSKYGYGYSSWTIDFGES